MQAKNAKKFLKILVEKRELSKIKFYKEASYNAASWNWKSKRRKAN